MPFSVTRTWVPGLALALALAVIAELLAQRAGVWLAHGQMALSPVLCAVVLGVFWRNVVGVDPRAEEGVRWTLQTLLRAGIALVGLRLTLHGLTTIGLRAIPIVIVCILVALTVGLLVGRWLGVPKPLRYLLALGTAVCGCTAVVIATPVVRARPEETGLAVTCIVVFGCTGMLVYPWLANVLFAGDARTVGLFLGTAIHDTSQVVGASLMYAQQFGEPDVVAAASLTKLMRNLSMLALIPMAGWFTSAAESGSSRFSVRKAEMFPAFLVAFLCMTILRSTGDLYFERADLAAAIWKEAVAAALTLSDILLVCGMAAVGLSVSFGSLRQMGWRPPVLAFLIALAVGACSASLTLALSK